MTDPVSAISSIAGALSAPGAAQNARPTPVSTVSFNEVLSTTMANTMNAVATSEATAMSAVHGNASLQDVVQATVNAEIALETAISIRNKIIESYQDIIRMPV